MIKNVSLHGEVLVPDEKGIMQCMQVGKILWTDGTGALRQSYTLAPDPTQASRLSDIINNSSLIKNSIGGFMAGAAVNCVKGGAIGSGAVAGDGGAVGCEASAEFGGAVGYGAFASSGGAVGEYTVAEDGFSGGKNAKSVDKNNNPINAIQLGEGTNEHERTLQVYDYQLMDAEGNIPAERLENTVGVLETEIDRKITTAEAIAKGRATGYVFDTLEDLDAWLKDETNTQDLALGDNFYIKAVDVPDYWWDGTTKQQLETQKVDLSEYVKNTDYATKEVAGVVKVRTDNYNSNGIRLYNGLLTIARATASAIKEKTAQCPPITPAIADYAVYYATHQDMSDDYDVSALKVIPELEGSQSQLPASYEAVKKYIDGIKGDAPQRGVDYWTDNDKAEIKSYVDEAILGGVW